MPTFAPGDDPRPRFRAADLRQFTTQALMALHLSEADAALAAEVLVDADLAGIESHGIAHLPWHPGYVPGLKRGIVNPTPNVTALRENATTAALDGDGGMGVVVGPKAMQLCIEKAEAAGISMVTVTNGRHFGAAGYYAKVAAERGLIGMAMCNVPPIGVAAGGLDRVYGTNPIAFGAPIEGQRPFLLDIATTAVAGGKLEIAQRQGKPIPAGWAMDADGNDTDDPEILRKGGGLLPLGSRAETSAHKGYGLGLMVDVLSGALSGVGFGYATDRSKIEQGYWFAAWKVESFRDPDVFQRDMREMADWVRARRPAPGVERVLIPGDPEWAARDDREANGIPLDAETIEQLQQVGEETSVAFPSPV